MPPIPEWIIGYGQLGIMFFLLYEIRDIRRWLKQHVEDYEHMPKRRNSDG